MCRSVIVSSGLVALVDNCIIERFHSRGSRQLFIPKLQLGVEYIGPKRLIDEIFRKGASGSRSRQSSTSRPSSSGPGMAARKLAGPVRQASEH